MPQKKVSVFRKAHFNAAHRLHVKDWSDEENNLIFGKCSHPNFHGHNYELTVKLTGEVDKKTGYVFDMKLLNDIIQQEVAARFDHRNLNLDTEEFADLNPTVENIAIVIYNLIRRRIDNKFDLQIRLYETERNFAEYPV